MPVSRLRIADLPRTRRRAQRVELASLADVPVSLESYERCAMERALAESGGDVTAAATRLGIGRSTFYRKLAKHALTPHGERGGPSKAMG